MLAAIADNAVLDKIRSFKKNDIHALLNYAQTLGFEFTVDDMVLVSKQADVNSNEFELTDAELEQVSGGHQIYTIHETKRFTFELVATFIATRQ